LKSTKPECYDVILFNERNEITETTTANIAFKIGDQWMTPPTKSGILRGIEREILLESGVIVEAVIDKSQLTSLTPTAIFNSLRGLKPAKITC
jgi:para-aminobenzoate synthetase/4-amino-4-deoxychorismate lyase